MSTNKTNHLNLHSWIKTDPFRMEEFNDNFTAIDTAVARNTTDLASANSRIDGILDTLALETMYWDSYIGDGKSSRTIELPFAPRIAIVRGYVGSVNAIAIFTKNFSFAVGAEYAMEMSSYIVLNGDKFTIKSVNGFNVRDYTTRYLLIR